MHKLDPKLPKEAQDKRMVAVLEKDAWDLWLEAKPELAKGLPRQCLWRSRMLRGARHSTGGVDAALAMPPPSC
jgi:hypothetical protein